MHAMAAFSGATATFPGTQNVLALAVATRSSAQTTCPMPVALRPKPGTTGPSYGFTPGEWVTMITQQSTIPDGEIDWANLDGSNSASETEAKKNDNSSDAENDPLGTPGVQASIVDAW